MGTVVISDVKAETALVSLIKGTSDNLVKWAEKVPDFYRDNLANNTVAEVAEYFRDIHGIGPSADGYIALPSVALDVLVTGLGADAGLPLTVAMSGVGRATVARSRARTGITDPDKSDAIKASGKAGKPSDKSDTEDTSETSVDAPAVDLVTLLTAMSDDELAAVIASLPPNRVAKLVGKLNALTAH
jgi:hypothetical protein